MQVPVNKLTSSDHRTVADNQRANGCKHPRPPTAIPPYRANTWCARLLYLSIHLWILHSPQLRHEAVPGRSSSLHSSTAKGFEWARIRRAPLPPQPTHSFDNAVRLRSAIGHQRSRANAQVSGVVSPTIPVRRSQCWRKRGAPFTRLPVHRAWS